MTAGDGLEPAAPPNRHASGGDLTGAGLIVLAAICFGTLGPISRYASNAGVGSLGLVVWRASLGAACMALFLAVMAIRGRSVTRRGVPARERWALGSIALANAFLNLAVFEAFLRISIALTLLIFYLYPAFVAVASVAWFGERLDRIRWAALGMSLAGTILVMAGAGTLGGLDALGIGLALFGAVTQAYYVLATRHGFPSVPVPEAAGISMGGAALIYVLIATATGQVGALAAPLHGIDGLLPVVAAGIVGAGIPTLAFMAGVRRLGAPRTAILATLEPVIGVALAAFLLAEQPTLLQLAGGVLIIAAGILLQRPGTQAEAAEHEAFAAGTPTSPDAAP